MNNERRKNQKLRDLFDEAYARLEHVLSGQPPKGLPVEWVVYRAARSAYPQLNTLDLYQFAVASSRIYRRRNPRAEGHLAF